jgi:fucokinase
VWPEGELHPRTLRTARLFPGPGGRLSLQQAARRLDLPACLAWRRRLHQRAVCGALASNLNFRHFPCQHLVLHRLAVREGWAATLLSALDSAGLALAGQAEGPGRTSRLAGLLAATADLLGEMAEGRGGLRSGPAHNPAFGPALRLVAAGRLEDGLAELQRARAAWLGEPSRLVRAARHYEGLVQALIRQTVLSAREQVSVELEGIPAARRAGLGEAVEARCPARLDLAGGWTDTPPICYEQGGRVVDLAIQVDGKKPIGCLATRVEETGVTIRLSHGETLAVRSRADMADHCSPTAPGALAKCCLLAAGLAVPSLAEEEFQARLAR